MGTGRDLWQWPLHSARRLIATVAVLAAVVIGLAVLVNSPDDGTPAADTADARPPATSSAPPSPSPSATPSRPSTRDYGRAIETARSFVTAWASHPKGWKTWYAGTARYTTARMAGQLATVDHRNVESTKVRGKLRLTDTGARGRTEVAVPTDAGVVSVTLLEDGGRWRVDDLQPGAQAVN